MNALISGRGLLAVAFFAAWGVATGANAGVFRAFLSSTGNDANPCSLAAPCRLLPAALAAVVNGGRITLLDSANYNTGTVNITKSVTIDANPGGSAGVAAINGDAIFINAAGVKVTLRNLVILDYGIGGTNGIDFAQGAQLNVENCEISNMINAGIYVTAPNSSVTVKNTELRVNFVGFWAAGTTTAILDSVNIHDGAVGIDVADGAHVTVTGSVIQNYATEIDVNAYNSSGAVLVIAHSTMTGSPSQVGINITALPGLIAEAFVEANTIHIGYGFIWNPGGGTETICSSGDNRIVFYHAAATGGTLCPIPGI